MYQIPRYNYGNYGRSATAVPSITPSPKTSEAIPQVSSNYKDTPATAPINTSTPVASQAFDTMTGVLCTQPIEFPNAAVGENLLVKYTDLVQRIKNDAQKQYDVFETVYEWADLVWKSGYVVLQMVDPTGIGSGVWYYLQERSGDSYSAHLAQLKSDIESGAADPKIVNKIAVISGVTDEAEQIRNVIYQLPSNELPIRLKELHSLRQRIVRTMGVISNLFGSIPYQIGYYYSLTIIDMNLKAICDRIKGIDPNIPQVVAITPALPPPANINQFVPEGGVYDAFEKQGQSGGKGGLVLLGIAALVGGALLL